MSAHDLVELLINTLRVPSGVEGTLNLPSIMPRMLVIDEDGTPTLYWHPEGDDDEPSPFDMSKNVVTIHTEEIERDEE
jgi:hypothetical protein